MEPIWLRGNCGHFGDVGLIFCHWYYVPDLLDHLFSLDRLSNIGTVQLIYPDWISPETRLREPAIPDGKYQLELTTDNVNYVIRPKKHIKRSDRKWKAA